MATHKSAEKAYRQSQKRRQRNRHHRSRLRTQIKKMRAALEAEDATSARDMLTGTLSLIDRTARLGVLHPNVAARTKSRLARSLNALQTKS